MMRRPPRSTHTYTLFPYTTLFRSTGDDRHVDTCLPACVDFLGRPPEDEGIAALQPHDPLTGQGQLHDLPVDVGLLAGGTMAALADRHAARFAPGQLQHIGFYQRSEEHTSELQSLMRISYAVFCLKKKTTKNTKHKQ